MKLKLELRLNWRQKHWLKNSRSILCAAMAEQSNTKLKLIGIVVYQCGVGKKLLLRLNWFKVSTIGLYEGSGLVVLLTIWARRIVRIIMIVDFWLVFSISLNWKISRLGRCHSYSLSVKVKYIFEYKNAGMDRVERDLSCVIEADFIPYGGHSWKMAYNFNALQRIYATNRSSSS